MALRTRSSTLQAYALVGSPFREPCQRILLRSMKIENRGVTNYFNVLGLLEDSPHIAAYVRTLHLILPSRDAASEIESFQHLLEKFGNVAYLRIWGQADSSWGDVPGIVQFIRRQTLEGLQIGSIIQLPFDLIPFILSSARTVCFTGVSAKPHGPHAPMRPKVENLILLRESMGIDHVLLSPGLAPHIGSLRRLRIPLELGSGSGIIATSAHTLEEICFDCLSVRSANGSTPFPLPDLPSLRFVEVRINTYYRNEEWFVDPICSLLTTTAEMIVVTFYPRNPVREDTEQFVLSEQTMHALNDALFNRGVFPRLQWRLLVENDQLPLDALTAAVKRGIPRADLAGRLGVESGPEDQLKSWPSGSMVWGYIG
ncbi:hypothetical protein B0H14DRAFT_1040419 [Mycena olivaceomarginata]|nr:hypothetical protein B0H14DRAFT_1040419 [Mycena olivaceomarginata]